MKLKALLPLSLLVICNSTYASDALTIDNLFKKQVGLRSVTNLSLVSSGNSSTYGTYPNLSINGDTTVWKDTKQLSLNQTFIYTITPKFDLLANAGGHVARHEYNNYYTGDFEHQNKTDFDSFWFGFIYTADSIGELIPQVTFQSSIIQRETAVGETKNFYLKSQSIEGSLRGYSDPVVYSVYSGFGYNQKRNFDFAKITYGNSFYFGGNLSIVLSPKITLDLGAEQRFQTEQEINGHQNSDIRSIPTMSFGSTYSINQDTAISVGASLGGSSDAPDSIFSVSLWQKF
ncbi:hypothetical protein A9K75_09420 [Campylobacter fetus subsp. testudinum]|uniref:hypothetical protein n=1 Tax=Campylobacter fetus TaxID=196 RepID=UPI00081894A7|nr:hypothetical protein [Campylobacter fetus]OCR98893.1 hypothetical protein A9K75_09420 [Campylobacter fetus subsp. testudinum]